VFKSILAPTFVQFSFKLTSLTVLTERADSKQTRIPSHAFFKTCAPALRKLLKPKYQAQNKLSVYNKHAEHGPLARSSFFLFHVHESMNDGPDDQEHCDITQKRM
jgi:hypothetical protein